MLPKLLGETTKREQPDLIDAVRGLIEANSPEGIAADLRALRNRPDRTADLASIACPTLVVAGGEDAIIPMADTEILQHGIAGAALVVLPGVGHLSNLEDAMGFNRALDQWLKKTSEAIS
jgi:pimeloyl-ACP methyl ester carboxylesterase